MKVLIVSYYFPPINSIASLRPYSWAKYWSKAGHDVTVLTADEPIRSNALIMDVSAFDIIRIKNRFKQRVLADSVNSIKEFTGTSSSLSEPSFFQKIKRFLQARGVMATARMPDFNDFVIAQSVSVIGEQQFDLVISSSGPYTEHIIAYNILKKQKHASWIVDYRDLWTQNHIFKGMWPFTWIEAYLEKKINCRANHIITVSQPLAKQIEDKFLVNNVSVIANGFDSDDLAILSDEPYWSDGKVRLVYTGSIYIGKQDPSPLLEAIRNISESLNRDLLNSFELVFIGGSQADLPLLIEKYGVSNWVKHNGFVSREDALRMQRDAHGVVFLEFNAPEVDGVLTGKIFEYLYSKTHIWGIGVTDQTSVGKLIQESHCGTNFGHDVDFIKASLVELLQSRKKIMTYPNEALLTKYSRKTQAEMLLNIATQCNK